MPAANLPELCTHLDAYARVRLTLADFEPILDVDSELPFDQITHDLFQALRRLEPFGMGNPEPVFAAHNLRVMAMPRVIKEKHVKLKLSAQNEDLGEAGVLPRVHAQSSDRGWRKSIVHDALGWRMAERIQQAELLPGDALDIAFTLDHNDHPEFGGLELSLRDFRCPQHEGKSLAGAAVSETTATENR
jgi:single-stranded-DNA-specific exonuclease